MCTILKNWEGKQMHGFLEKMFKATGHSPGGAEKGRESSVPLPALTTIYAVSIKMSLDERKSLPKPKVTILSIKLPHHKTLQFPFAHKGNFD